jgi:predicted enzyme related to lactoylglutathione lyase
MGKVQHFEIPADDVSRAKAFYAGVFGWTFTEWDADNLMISPGGDEGEVGVIGGDIHRRERPEAPTVVITVDAIEDALEQVEKAGGRRDGEIQELDETSRYAYFIDPEGNRIGVYDSTSHAD